MYRPSSYLTCLALVALSFTPSVQAAEMRWNLNDVSYLFPIPQGHEQNADHLLHPDRAGRQGVLLPEAIRQAIPTLLVNGNGNGTLFAERDIRVVSVRVDPCPALAQKSCVPEVRMVLQPVQFDRLDGKWTARDAAVHTVYRLSTTEFEQLTGQLWQLKIAAHQAGVSTHKRPLGVHPALANPGTAKRFNDQLQKLLLDYCGENNLIRVTFMSLMIPTQWWRFGGFERTVEGRWNRLIIPRLGAPDEDIFNTALEEQPFGKGTPGREMDATFNVLPDEYPENDNIFPLIDNSYRQENEDNLSVFRSRLDAVARFRNPHKTNFDTLDCAACHYADASRFYAEKSFPELKGHLSPDSYRNPDPGLFDLENTTVGRAATRILRGFGYFDDQPALNQRAIHESAEAAHWLNTHD